MSSTLDDSFLDQLEKWSEKGIDDRITYAYDIYNEWNDGFENDEKIILSELIKKFHYYSRDKVNEIIQDIDVSIIKKYKLTKNNTIISVIRKEWGLKSSSADYWNQYSYVSGLGNKVFFDSLDELDDDDWKHIENVIFIDDCSGTGKTIKKFIIREQNKLQKRGLSLKDKNIVIIVMEIMEDAVTYINDFANKKGFKIEIEKYLVSEKAFKSNSSLKADYEKLAKKKKINSVLGFDKTESLMAFHNNSPNNTLGIFWENNDEYKAIFPRNDDDEPDWLKNKKEKKRRERERLESKKK